MRVVAGMFSQNLAGMDDAEFIRQEIDLAVLAEELGFDMVSFTEHHFDAYSMSPDNFLTLAHVAARTSRIGLLPAVAVLPWNDPVRVAEKAVLLDILSNGRAWLGLGRGLAKVEYDAFGVDMNEARERFDEGAQLVLNALETGVAESDGKFIKQQRVEIRPAPMAPFRDRCVSVAMSPGSARATGALGTPLMSYLQPIEAGLPVIEAYREGWREQGHAGDPPGPVLADITYCHAPGDEPDEIVQEAWLRQVRAGNEHYDFAQKHTSFSDIKGYESYAAMPKPGETAEAEREDAARIWESQANGTPEEIIATWKHRLDLLGGEAMAHFTVSWGGLPREYVERSMRLLASEVLPELQQMGVTHAGATS